MNRSALNFIGAEVFSEQCAVMRENRAPHKEFEKSVRYFEDIVEYAGSSGADAFFCIHKGALIAAVGYSSPELFFFPRPLLRGASIRAALRAIRDYCRDSSVDRVISDIPASRLGEAMNGVRHGRVEDIGEGFYSLSVETECMLAKYPPEVEFEELNLSEPTLPFAEEYARLIFDDETNRYTGEDLRREMTDAPPEYFVEEARAEFDSGKALTLFATILSDEGKNIFIGEGVFYSFDGEGRAEIAIKLLPEWRGRGFGSKLLSAMLLAAESISLCEVVARVHKDNLPSLRVFSSLMDRVGERDGLVYFSHIIES